MKKLNSILFALIALLTLSLSSPASMDVLVWNGSEMISSNEKIMDGEAIPVVSSIQFPVLDCYDIQNERVMIYRCGENKNGEPWVSPSDWQIKQVIYADLNRDGTEEFGLLVWRPFKPWPIDKFLPNPGRIADFHDDQNLSCHFILIGWDGGKYRELWAGSALADPISHLKAADINQDGYDELVAIEGKYDSSADGNLTIWKWQGFGFTLLDRIEGVFSNYTLFSSGRNVILVPDS